MDTIDITSDSVAPTLEPLSIPLKTFSTPLDRDKFILERFSAGDRQCDIGKQVGLSEVRIGQIVRSNKAMVIIDKEFEKARRFRRLKFAEEKASKAIAPKDSDQLVRLIAEQRKELEGDSRDSSSVINNTQINLDLSITNPLQIWNLIRNTLDKV